MTGCLKMDKIRRKQLFNNQLHHLVNNSVDNGNPVSDFVSEWVKSEWVYGIESKIFRKGACEGVSKPIQHWIKNYPKFPDIYCLKTV